MRRMLFALLPLVGAADSLVKGVGIAAQGVLAVGAFVLLLPLLRRHAQGSAYWLAALLMAAGLCSIAELLGGAFFHDLQNALQPWTALLAVPCLLLAAQTEDAAGDGLLGVLAFTATALALGGLREILGSGTLLADAEWLFGPLAAEWVLHVTSRPATLFALAPGGLILLGLLLALRRRLRPPYRERT